MRVLFTGGGTGGHLFPIIAVARHLKKIAHSQNIGLEMFFLGPNDFTKQALEKENIKTKTIIAGKVRRYFSIFNILDIFKAPIGLAQALWYLFAWMPDIIFNKGGYGSVPVVIIGWLFRIPILTHESDTMPGLANRLASPLSKRIAISFAITTKYFPKKKTALVGHPVRQTICQGTKEEAKKFFNITSDKPVLFSTGGSQGAQAINTIIFGTLPQLLEKYEVIHVCGQKNYEAIKEKGFIEKGSLIFPFLDEEQLKHAFGAADLVISRAGAGSIFEIAACGKASILIPLPLAASNHQNENAFEFAKTGATLLIDQANLTPHLFLAEIARLFKDKDHLANMSKSAQSFAKIEAGQKIAQALIELSK